MTTKYFAGWSMPGYLPESESFEAETFGEAKDYLVEELEREAKMSEDVNRAAAFDRLAKEAALRTMPGNIGTDPDGYTYWIERDESRGWREYLREIADGYLFVPNF